jgi:hypothetical protein
MAKHISASASERCAGCGNVAMLQWRRYGRACTIRLHGLTLGPSLGEVYRALRGRSHEDELARVPWWRPVPCTENSTELKAPPKRTLPNSSSRVSRVVEELLTVELTREPNGPDLDGDTQQRTQAAPECPASRGSRGPAARAAGERHDPVEVPRAARPRGRRRGGRRGRAG